MKKEYYNRGKKIEVEQLTDTLAVKQEVSSKIMKDVESIEENFGTRTKLYADTTNADRSSAQQQIFEKAGCGYGRINALAAVNAAMNKK